MAKKDLIIKGKTIGKGTPLVCVPVMATTRDGIIAQAKELIEDGVEMIEWRVDMFDNYRSLNAIRDVLADLKPLVKDTILLFTYRSKPQGGNGAYDKDMIRDINEAAAETGVCDMIDFEYFAAERHVKSIRALQKKGIKVIVSHHDFDETPPADVIRIILEEEYESGADIVKLAIMPNSMQDVLTLLSETVYFHEEHKDIPLVTMSMGPMGSVSRFTGEYFGSCITFAAGRQASAPGQLPQKELRAILDGIHNCMTN